MGIVFDQIPTANRRPDAFVEIDGSRALGLQPGEIHRALIIAIKSAAGSATAGQLVDINSESAGDALFGINSQAAAIAYFFKRVNPRARLQALVLEENAAGTAATGTFAISGTATKDSTLTVRIGRTRVSVPVKTTDTPTTIATALAAAINAAVRVPFSAAAATGTVTVTCRHKGDVGNHVTIKTLVKPDGLTVADTQPSGGLTNPSVATSIAALPDVRFDTIVNGLADAANMALLEAEADRRWGPTIKQPVHIIAAVRGTYSGLQTYGAGRNSPRSTVMGAGLSPTEPWIWAAQVAARDAEQSDVLPNRPRNGMTLPDCEAPASGDEFDPNENNQLLYSGISTYKVDPSGRVLIERLITTYRVNANGVSDATYLAIETVRNLAGLLLDFVALGSKHNRDLLGPDGKNVAPGVPISTPKTIRGEINALYAIRERGGRVKDSAGFAADLLVELDETDVERMNVLAVPRLVNGFVTMAIRLAFQL